MHEEMAPRMLPDTATEAAAICPPYAVGTGPGRGYTLEDFTRAAGKSPERQTNADRGGCTHSRVSIRAGSGRTGGTALVGTPPGDGGRAHRDRRGKRVQNSEFPIQETELRVCERIGSKRAESGVRRRKSSIRSSLLPSALRFPYSVIDPFTASQSRSSWSALFGEPFWALKVPPAPPMFQFPSTLLPSSEMVPVYSTE